MTPHLYRGALDAGGVGIWIHDPRSGRAEWSAAMASLHDVPATEGSADELFVHVHASDRPGVDEAVAHALHLDEPIRFEYRVESRDGGRRWLAVSVASAPGPDGEPVVTALATDVSARKEAELSTARRRARVEGLQWVSQAIIAGEGLRDTAAGLVDSSADVLGATAGVMLYPAPGDDGESLAMACTGFDAPDGQLPGSAWPTAVGPAAGVVVVGDVPSRPGVRDLLVTFGFPERVAADAGSALLVPIGTDAAAGALCFVRDVVGYFSEADVELATAIGSTSAAAMENALRYEQHRLAAETFQQALLPAPRTGIEGFDLCTQYRPGRDGLDVGGDWFDVLDLGDRIGLAVGDVCGHGLTAAAHMGELRYSFRALMHLTPDAEAALGVLNDIALDLRTTATVAYAEIDRASGACRVWRCGHPPPVIVSGGGSIRWLGGLRCSGPMLGFVDSMSCEPIVEELDAGEVLLLYTDGLVERREEAIDTGLDRLGNALAETVSVDDLVERCGALTTALALPGPRADDVALVAARRAARF